MSNCLKVVSLNTWKNEGFYQDRLKLMGDGLLDISPDVVLLQECFRCEETGDDTAAFLARRLGFECRYAPARRKARFHEQASRETESGLAILSRSPFRDEGFVVPLPSSDAGGERIALAASVVLGERVVGCVCVHFSHIGGEQAIRQDQIARSLLFMRDTEGFVPGILGGDFNCEWSSREADGAIAFAQVDCVSALPFLSVLDPTTPVPTVSGQGRQIDQIWCVDGKGEARFAPLSAGLCLNGLDPRTGLHPSDHAGVWVELEIG